MSENRESLGQGNDNPVGVLGRIKRFMGFVAVDTLASTESRPAVEPYVRGRMSVMDYARRNAARSGIDLHDPNNGGVFRLLSNLNKTYSGYIEGRYSTLPQGRVAGFSEDYPEILFKWNISDDSRETSEKVLYLLGAEPDAPARHTTLPDGMPRVTQKYVSSTGLHFVDLQDHLQDALNAGIAVSKRDAMHILYAYLPPENQHTYRS